MAYTAEEKKEEKQICRQEIGGNSNEDMPPVRKLNKVTRTLNSLRKEVLDKQS